MATLVEARHPGGPVRGRSEPPNATVETLAEEMINGILCHYEPPDQGRHTSKNRSILRQPSFGNGRSRSDLTTATSFSSAMAPSSSGKKKKNVRWIDTNDDKKSSSGGGGVAGPATSHCGSVGTRILDGCMSPTAARSNGKPDTTYGSIWSTMSEESEIPPCRPPSHAVKDAVFDEDGNPVYVKRSGSNSGTRLPSPSSAPPPRRKEVFIPELCGVRINCFEDEEQMEELGRHPYGRPPPAPSHNAKKGGSRSSSSRRNSVDYEDDENSLTHEEEEDIVKSSGSRRRSSSSSRSRSRRSSSSSSSSNKDPSVYMGPRDAGPRDDFAGDSKKNSSRKKNDKNKTSRKEDDWEETSSPPSSGSSSSPAPATYGPPSLRRDDNGEIINQSDPGDVMDPITMSRAASDVNVPQSSRPQLKQQQAANDNDDWDQTIPIVSSLLEFNGSTEQPHPTKSALPTETAKKKKAERGASSKQSKKEMEANDRAKAKAADKEKRSDARQRSDEKKKAERRRSEGEKKKKRSTDSKELQKAKRSDRASEDLRKIEEAKGAAQDLKRLEELRIAEVSDLSDQARRTEEKIRLEERRKEEELKRVEELRREEKKIAEELKKAEEIRADAMKRAKALMKVEQAKEANILRQLEEARNDDLSKLSDINPSSSDYPELSEQGSVILSTELTQGRSSSSRFLRGRKKEDEKDSRRRSSFDPMLLMRRRSRSRSPGRSKLPGRSKSPSLLGRLGRNQKIDSTYDEYATSTSRSQSPTNSDEAGLNDYGEKTRNFGTASEAMERESFITAHRDSAESTMQVNRERAARAQRNRYLGHPPMPHLHPAHPLNQYRQRQGDDRMERQSFITAHRQGFDSSKMEDDRQSFITAHREGFEVSGDDSIERESFITDHRRSFESPGLGRNMRQQQPVERHPPVAQPDYVVETASSDVESMGTGSPLSAESFSVGSTSMTSTSVDHSIPAPPKIRPTLTTSQEPEKKEEEMSWEEKTRLAWERIRNGFGLTNSEENTEEVPALQASEDSASNDEGSRDGKHDTEEGAESESESPNETPASPGSLTTSPRRSKGSPRRQKHLKGILKTPTPEKHVTFGKDSEKVFDDDQDENKPAGRSSPLNAHIHPHTQHGHLNMAHNHPHQQQQQPLQSQPHLQQPQGTPPIHNNKSKKPKRVFRGKKIITQIFKGKTPQGQSPQGSKSPRGRSPLGRSPQASVAASASTLTPRSRLSAPLDGTHPSTAALDSTKSMAGSGSIDRATSYTPGAPGMRPGIDARNYGSYEQAIIPGSGNIPDESSWMC